MPDATTLLTALAAAIAEAADLNYDEVPAGESRQLYTHRMDRREADATASVIRLAGGPHNAWFPTITLTVQCLTQGPTEAAAMARAWAIRGAMSDAHGRGLRDVTIGDWRVLRMDPIGEPAPLGVLDGGGADVSFNWQIEAVIIGG